MNNSNDKMPTMADLEVEMPEYGPLLGDESVEMPGSQYRTSQGHRRSQWLLRSAMLFLCLGLLCDNIRLRMRRVSESAFVTDLSK